MPSVVSSISVERAPVLQAPPRDLLDILIESEAAALSAGVKPVMPATAPIEEDEAHEPAASSGLAHAAAENMLRVDATRIDTVMNLVGEMIIGKSMLQRAMAEFERRHSKDPLRGRLADALAFQSRVLGELQKSVMKIRMVPVEQLFRRFPRIVRDVARLRNKDIVLELAGENTDLDKSILDALSDPLAHLVRNAADHGIETGAEREAAGKSAARHDPFERLSRRRSGRNRSVRRRPRTRPRKDRPPRHRTRTTFGPGSQSAQRDGELSN